MSRSFHGQSFRGPSRAIVITSFTDLFFLFFLFFFSLPVSCPLLATIVTLILFLSLPLPLSVSLAAFDASCITRRRYSPRQFLAKIVRPCLSFGPGCHRCHPRRCKQTNAGGCPRDKFFPLFPSNEDVFINGSE